MSILCNNDFINISIPKGRIQYDNLLIGGCFVCDSWLPLSSYNLCNSSSSSIISTNAQKKSSKNLSRAAYEILKARSKKRTDGPCEGPVMVNSLTEFITCPRKMAKSKCGGSLKYHTTSRQGSLPAVSRWIRHVNVSTISKPKPLERVM